MSTMYVLMKGFIHSDILNHMILIDSLDDLRDIKKGTLHLRGTRLVEIWKDRGTYFTESGGQIITPRTNN